jgi:uncharacterized protein with GYD domain
VQYFYPDDRRVYSISTSEDIREITHAGTPSESSRPAGHDSGYLWRAATFNNLIATDEGVFCETETLGLSRSFPTMLGWFIEPIANASDGRACTSRFRNSVRRSRPGQPHVFAVFHSPDEPDMPSAVLPSRPSEDVMPKFLIKATYTSDGAKGLLKEGGTKRRAAVQKIIEAAGGKVEVFYYAFGEDDAFIIADLPDTTTGLGSAWL